MESYLGPRKEVVGVLLRLRVRGELRVAQSTRDNFTRAGIVSMHSNGLL